MGDFSFQVECQVVLLLHNYVIGGNNLFNDCQGESLLFNYAQGLNFLTGHPGMEYHGPVDIAFNEDTVGINRATEDHLQGQYLHDYIARFP